MQVLLCVLLKLEISFADFIDFSIYYSIYLAHDYYVTVSVVTAYPTIPARETLQLNASQQIIEYQVI